MEANSETKFPIQGHSVITFSPRGSGVGGRVEREERGERGEGEGDTSKCQRIQTGGVMSVRTFAYTFFY